MDLGTLYYLETSRPNSVYCGHTSIAPHSRGTYTFKVKEPGTLILYLGPVPDSSRAECVAHKYLYDGKILYMSTSFRKFLTEAC